MWYVYANGMDQYWRDILWTFVVTWAMVQRWYMMVYGLRSNQNNRYIYILHVCIANLIDWLFPSPDNGKTTYVFTISWDPTNGKLVAMNGIQMYISIGINVMCMLRYTYIYIYIYIWYVLALLNIDGICLRTLVEYTLWL